MEDASVAGREAVAVGGPAWLDMVLGGNDGEAALTPSCVQGSKESRCPCDIEGESERIKVKPDQGLMISRALSRAFATRIRVHIPFLC